MKELSYVNMVVYQGEEVDFSTLPEEVKCEIAIKICDRMCAAVGYRREERTEGHVGVE